MSGNAFLFTKRRLTDDHYLAIALREARDMKKPPITMTNFWKHAESYDDVEKPLHDLLAWLDREAEIGDYLNSISLQDLLNDDHQAHETCPLTQGRRS